MSRREGNRKKQKYELKSLFEERMRRLLTDEKDFEAFNKIIHQRIQRWIRCNTLKIKPRELLRRLRKKWNVKQPYSDFPEIMLIEGKLAHKPLSRLSTPKLEDLGPGELGNSIEHLLGYFYVQEVSSMLPPIALKPEPGEFVLDLCASPGSKTTQMAAMMENSGTIIANDIKLDRVKILNANLERCGVTNVVVTRNDGVGLCNRISKKGWKFDKILLDVPCSGEGTLRSSPKTFKIWNYKVVKKLSREQKKLFAFALRCLKPGGEVVYSTCTHSPEENEAVVDFVLKTFGDKIEVEKVSLPLKCRPGVTEWKEDSYNSEVSKTCRIYPQDNDSEGFFVAKFRLKEEVKG
jgi:tRNA (cytosine49-C5)-methyltransferase